VERTPAIVPGAVQSRAAARARGAALSAKASFGYRALGGIGLDADAVKRGVAISGSTDSAVGGV
jgi:hypothetical protein